jgi:hypothetical protein
MKLSKATRQAEQSPTYVSSLGLMLVLLVLCLNPTLASALSIELTRFGTCLTPPGGCSITINDNLAGDLNPTPGVIDFAAVVGQLPDGVFIGTGRAIETITHDAAGRVTSILLNLTNTTVQGVAGGIGTPSVIAGEIGLISGEPLASLNGVAGFAGLNGQYQNPTGTIGFANISLAARVDGCLVGQVVPPGAVNVPSPVPFAGFNARNCIFPVNNLLIGTLDFSVAPGDGFFLPTSADSFATPIPEPTTLLLLGTAMTGLGLAARWRRRQN